MSQDIVHVVPGLGRNQGGPSYTVPRLCEAQRKAGAVVSLLSVDTPGDEPLSVAGAMFSKQDFAAFPVLREMRLSAGLRKNLRTVLPAARVVHAHGLWLMSNVDAGLAAQRYRRPLVVSPRGMLARQALQISRFRKKVFWQVFQRGAYAHAALWHATCEAEAEEIRQFGIRAPIAIVPNGIDLSESRGRASRTKPSETRTVLFLGRVHPKKGLMSLIEAWARIEHAFPDWRLRIVGPSEGGHSSELTAHAAALGVANLSVEPAVFGLEKDATLARASLFVLPTLNENFGVAVAEALEAGVPAIVTRGAPWAGLEAHQCGWWVEHGVEPLSDALRRAMSLAPAERSAMGDRGRAWMARDFSWDRIGADMLAAYEWAADGGSPPPTIYRG